MGVFGNQKGFSFIGLLFKLVVLCFVLYLFNRYYSYFIFDRNTRQLLKREGVSTAVAKQMAESLKEKADAVRKYLAKREQAMAKQKQEMDSMFYLGK
jgi:hypothetical protein